MKHKKKPEVIIFCTLPIHAEKEHFWARFTLNLNEWRERIMTVYWMNRYSRRLYRCFYFDEKYLKILFTISIVSRHRYSYIHYYNIMKLKSSSRVDELIFLKEHVIPLKIKCSSTLRLWESEEKEADWSCQSCKALVII